MNPCLKFTRRSGVAHDDAVGNRSVLGLAGTHGLAFEQGC
jgi:hypothetical protein